MKYLSRSMGVEYLRPDELLSGVDICVPAVSSTAPREAVLEAIAREVDPMVIVRNCAQWRRLSAALASNHVKDGSSQTIAA
jgi:hypothetical protein